MANNNDKKQNNQKEQDSLIKTKLNINEINKIKELLQTKENITNKLGIIEINYHNIKKQLFDQLEYSALEEKKLKDSLEEKYGEGSIDLNKWTYNVVKSEEDNKVNK